ncbi:MAG TPA: hypothetical protein VFW66_03265 [Gemmatimonadales bacterium]|nr:hypothetical protein [Gemmatimonadales bacterium]
MWWYGGGWWWWWILFVVILFIFPLGYGWGYRGWGPWYQRSPGRRRTDVAPGTATTETEADVGAGWGWLGCFLWIILIIAIIWLIAALGWGGRYH